MPLAALGLDAPLIKAEVDWVHDALTIAYRNLVLAQGRHAWHRLEETSGTSVVDSSGNGRAGTLTSAPNADQTEVGAITGDPANNAWRWTGANEIASHHPAKTVAGDAPEQGYTNGVIWEGWFRAAAYPGAAVPLMWSSAGSSPGVVLLPAGAVSYRQMSGWSEGAIEIRTAVGVFLLDIWNHVVVRVTGTHDGTGSADPPSVTELWINGVRAASSVGHGGFGPNMRWMDGGVEQAGAVLINKATTMRFAPTSHGVSVDELSTRDGALTPDDINRLYVARTANFYTAPTYTDESGNFKGAAWGRGRNDESDKLEPSTIGVSFQDAARRYEPEHAGSPLYPNVLPGKQLRLSCSRVNGPGPTGATLSGNEISDLVRLLGVSGDGRAAEGSMGIWEATTNLDTNGGFESNLTGWAGTATRSHPNPAPWKRFGQRSMKVVTTGANQTVERDVSGLTASTVYTRSIWVRREEAAAVITVAIRNNANSADLASVTVPAAVGEHRVTVTATLEAGQTVAKTRVTISASGVTCYLDGAQLEQQPLATPYVRTDGAAVTRGAARVQLPAGLLDETMGAIAFRLRPGWAANADPHGGTDPVLFQWKDDAGNRFTLSYVVASDVWRFVRRSGGSGVSVDSAVQTFAALALLTILVAWTATQVKISVNGGPFVVAANATVPTLAAALFDVGSDAGAAPLDGDVLSVVTWSA